MKRRFSSLIARIMLILNLLLVFSLMLSYLSLFVSPDRNWVLPFFGLLYPYLLLLNIILFIYWILKRRWYLIFSLATIILGWDIIWRTVQVNFKAENLQGKNSLRLMSYNVHNMLYGNARGADLQDKNSILQLIRTEMPDILCIQEFKSVGKPPEAVLDSMSADLKLPYFKYTRYNERESKSLDAIVTFSRFPILSTYSLKIDGQHYYFQMNDLLMGEDTIRLFNVHLESVRFKYEDYTFINDLDFQFEENEKFSEGSRRIVNKLRGAYVKRSAQVKKLKELLKDSPYPLVICGDFNDTPCSYSYQVLSNGRKDAFIESGSGFGNTYAGTLPSLRIDYILYDPYFEALEYTTLKEKLSDHYPVTALIGHRDNPESK